MDEDSQRSADVRKLREDVDELRKSNERKADEEIEAMKLVPSGITEALSELRESRVTASEDKDGVSVWTLALGQIVPALCLTSIAIAALVMGGIDGKDVALSATSGLAGFAAARGLTK